MPRACYLLPSYLLTHPHASTNKRSHTRACARSQTHIHETGTAYYVDSATQHTQWERPAYVIEKWEEHNEAAAQYMLQEWETARATAARVGQGEGDVV